MIQTFPFITITHLPVQAIALVYTWKLSQKPVEIYH